MYRTKKAIILNELLGSFFGFFWWNFIILGDYTSTLKMNLKEKKCFSVFNEEYPHGCDRNAGSENDWKEESAGSTYSSQ